MIENNSGRIFVYDDNRPMLSAFKDIFDSRSLRMFGTDNMYKLLNYTGEITPNVMVFDLSDGISAASFKEFIAQNTAANCPIIVIKPQHTAFNFFPEIAHYLHFPADMHKFTDIIESYCIGGKRHDVLLLDSYSENAGKFRQQLEQYGYTYFEVHNDNAARIYLSKNNPKAVCIEYTPHFIAAHHYLRHNRIFYVDREQDITEIKKFIG